MPSSVMTVESRAAGLLTGVPRSGRVALVLAFLLGALLPIQWRLEVAGTTLNFCAADVVVLPAALVLARRCLHSRGLGWWVFALWAVNLVAWVCSLSLLTPLVFELGMVKIVTCYLFALVGYAVGSVGREERALVKGMVFASVPIAAIAIQAFFTGVPAVFIDEARVVGLFTDPNAFGCFLAIMVTLVMSLPVDLIAIPLFIGAGVVTFSRTGLIGILVSLMLGSTHARMRRYLPIVVLTVVVAAAVWAHVFAGHMVGFRVLEYQGSLDTRMALWNRAYDVATAHPVIGIGRGNWSLVSQQKTIPHNTLLSVAADTGLVGLAVFAVPLLIWLSRGLKRRATRPWAIALLINMVGGMAISFDNYRPFWLCTGVLVAQLAMAVRGEQAEATARPAEPDFGDATMAGAG